MSAHMDVLKKNLGAAPVRAAGEAMRFAVAVTDNELWTGRSGMFGWTSKIERFPLAALAEIRMIPNPSANLLQLEFAGTPPRTLAIMYSNEAESQFAQIATLLRQRGSAGVG